MKTKQFLKPVLVLAVLMATNSAMSEVTTINGKEPMEFFSQFFYRTVGSCNGEREFGQLLLASNNDHIVLPQATDGRNQRADFRVYIYSDLTFFADYEESIVSLHPYDFQAYNLVRNKRIEGHANLLPNGQLELEGIGYLEGLTYNGKPAVRLTPYKDLLSPGIDGKKVVLNLARNTFSAERIAEICEREPDFDEK